MIIPSNMLRSEKPVLRARQICSRPRQAGPLSLSAPCPRRQPTETHQHRWVERGRAEPEEPQRHLSAATRWRCGSGDSGSCLTGSPRTEGQDPGPLRDGTHQDKRAASRTTRPQGGRKRLLRTLSHAHPTGMPLPSVLRPACDTEAASGSAGCRGKPGTPQRHAGSPQESCFSLPALPSSLPLSSSPSQPASQSQPTALALYNFFIIEI